MQEGDQLVMQTVCERNDGITANQQHDVPAVTAITMSTLDDRRGTETRSQLEHERAMSTINDVASRPLNPLRPLRPLQHCYQIQLTLVQTVMTL
jgi:hypothetical protein